MEKYKHIWDLGTGTFGKVTKAVNKTTEEIVAIKAMKQKFYSWDECMQLREIKSLRILKDHQNIVKLNEVLRTNNDLFFIFEYVQKDLYKVMKGDDFEHSSIKAIMYQLLNGLRYIHKNGFFHRDLKPENILMSDGKVKIADFGLAREIRSKPPYTDYVSTRWYRAPELLLKSTNYNSPVDIFAAGWILAELYQGRPLFPGSSEGDQLMKVWGILGTPSSTNWPEGHKLASSLGYNFPKMSKVSLEELIPDAPKEAIDLIEKMLEYDPNSRLTAKEWMEHDFFADYTPKTFAKVPRPAFGKSPVSNKNNKLLNSKFIRMNSKKFEDERKKSPIYEKRREGEKPLVTKNIRYPQVGKIKNFSLDRGGFYMNNKPVKSPGTSNAPTSPKTFSVNKSYGSK